GNEHTERRRRQYNPATRRHREATGPRKRGPADERLQTERYREPEVVRLGVRGDAEDHGGQERPLQPPRRQPGGGQGHVEDLGRGPDQVHGGDAGQEQGEGDRQGGKGRRGAPHHRVSQEERGGQGQRVGQEQPA